MDAGWVKTFDQYYYGTKSNVSPANVQLIYHSVLSELLHDRRRRFTFSETAYFWRWWKEQRGTTRATFRSLVAEGRIQFAGGGWVQADEATVDYLQMLDQYTWGLRKLNDTLGPCGTPKAAWQVDTYGHTKEYSSLLAQMGFDGLFIGRVDYKEREAMFEEDRMEFMWRGSEVLGKMSDILTHTLFNLYNAPEGFCFDLLCSDDPIVDDPDSTVFNVDVRANTFISLLEKQAKYYDHDNILVTMGGDFTYQSAANWFMNIDKLINYVMSNKANISDVNMFYSTPSCYLKAVYLHGRRDKTLYTEKGDHLPYGSDVNTYWTGFYTSRPSLKYLAKRGHVFLQVVKQLSVLSRMEDSYELHLLRHATSLVLHHDAITGTSQQHVTNDFVRILSEAIDACSKKVSHFLSVLTPTWGISRRTKNNQQFIICHQLNMSQCRFLESQETILLIVYNPLSVKTYHHIRLPAIALHYSIKDYNDEEVEHQIVSLPTSIINLPGRISTALHEICFEAENIPPLGFTTYYISSIRDPLAEGEFAKESHKPETSTEPELLPFISNEYIKVTFNLTTGFLESIQHIDGNKVMISQNWYYYSQNKNSINSGAYSFRPGNEKPLPVTEKVTYHTNKGPLVKEVTQRFTDWITQTTRLYRGEEFVEVEWVIGPVPVGTDMGKEVVTIFKTNVTNNNIFYTDSNGRQMMSRSCWNQSGNGDKRKLPACLYPVSKICIDNTKDAICVLTDRVQGGTSYNGGEIELMVHRRLLTDDGFGLEETLNEEEFNEGLVVRGKHRIVIGNRRVETEDLSFFERISQMYRRWMYEPWLFFTHGEKLNKRRWQHVRNKRFTGIRPSGLPNHIHILTLEPWKGGSVLVRLENILEKSGPNMVSSPPGVITVNLRKVFQFIIKRVDETTLAANQWLHLARQMDWSSRYVYSGGEDKILPEDNPDYVEELRMSKEDRETDPNSEERYTRNSRRRQFRNKQKDNRLHKDIRRKREVSVTESKIDNIKTNITKQEYTKKDNHNSTLKPDIFKGTKNIRRFSLLKPMKPTGYVESRRKFIDYSKEEEEEEDSSPIASKQQTIRLNRKNNRTSTDYSNVGDFDDGVTKSMYEMYYKTKPIRRPVQMNPRSSEEHVNYSETNRRTKVDSRRMRQYNENNKRQIVDNNSEEFINEGIMKRNLNLKRRSKMVTSRSKGRKSAVPSSVIDERVRQNERRRNREKYREDYDRPFYSAEEIKSSTRYKEEYPEEYEEENLHRIKRETKEQLEHFEQSEQTEQTEQDYSITLRPSQIRTFVIWFEQKRQTL